MAAFSGKRKRRSDLIDDEVKRDTIRKDSNTTNLQSFFQQHFEANFEPLEGISNRSIKVQNEDVLTPESQSDSDWDGFSDAGEISREVICVTKPSARVRVPKEEMKTFMTTKPPSSSKKHTALISGKQSELPDDGSAATDAANIKKDLALQRLLRESHLLDSKSSLAHTGPNRHKAMDLRLQDMGSKSSIFKQEKMPLAQRKGIHAKSTERDVLRRRQAQENGIVLEKAFRGKEKDIRRRERGIGAPKVGKFQGGMLKLSKKDVAEIEGPRKSSKGRK